MCEEDTTTKPSTMDMQKVVDILRERFGVYAMVEQTGGGVATIQARPTFADDDNTERFSALAGPGWFDGPGWSNAYAAYDGFYVGPDDDGDTNPYALTRRIVLTEFDVAKVIAGQVEIGEARAVVDGDKAIGIDNIARDLLALWLVKGVRTDYGIYLSRETDPDDTDQWLLTILDEDDIPRAQTWRKDAAIRVYVSGSDPQALAAMGILPREV